MRYATLLIAGSVITGAGCSGELTGSGIPMCTTATAYTIGTSVTGTVDEKDCKDVQGNVGDAYSFTVTDQMSMVVNYTGSGFKPDIILYTGTIANSSASKVVADVAISDFTQFQAFLKPGSYYFMVTSENASGGSYNFSTSAPASTNGCNRNMIVRGQTFTGQITTNDCTGIGAARADMFNFYLNSGETVGINYSTNKGGTVSVRDDGNAAAADLINRSIGTPTGGTVAFSYTATKSGWVFVAALSEPANTGVANYTVTIN
ncbi:MAG TPA: hypothetical protein VM100_06470 [Longimicrobiales bacterium]|nr:hypothetical protein [Longimicrobiales bacterium]